MFIDRSKIWGEKKEQEHFDQVSPLTHQFEILVSSLIHEKNIENCTFLEENSVDRKPYKQRKKYQEIIIYLYRCYERYEAFRSFNTTAYLSWGLHSEDILEEKVHTHEHEMFWSLQC